MDNKKLIKTVGIAIASFVGVYLVYYYMFGGGSAAGKKAAAAKLKALNKTAASDVKAVAAVKQQIATTKAANPTDPTLAKLEAQMTQLLAQSATSKQAAAAAGGKTNADGSTPVAGTTPKTKVPMTTVDAQGDYIEVADPTTLYNQNGDVIGDLNAETGFFEDTNGKVIAACDGTPIAKIDANDNYMEADGQWYDNSGNAITLNGDGITYIDSTDAVDVYNMNGDVVGQLNGDGTYTNTSDGMDYILDTGVTIGKASDINSYNADGLHSVDYTNGYTLLGNGTLNDDKGVLVANGVKYYDVASNKPIMA